VCRATDLAIAIDSAPGAGTTVRFECPAALVRVRRDRPLPRESFAPPASGAGPPGDRITPIAARQRRAVFVPRKGTQRAFTREGSV